MAFFSDFADRITAMRDLVGDPVEAEELPARVEALDGEAVIALLRHANEIVQTAEQVSLVAAGVIARRSARETGQSGLAQSHGHRNATSLIQDVTGSSRADAARHGRVGEALLTDDHGATGERATPDDETAGAGPERSVENGATSGPGRWDDVLRTALFRRAITNQQHDAIRRGLGEPPTPDDATAVVAESAREAWAVAGEQLISEAAHRTLEELRIAARTIRDRLDPDGAEARFLKRHEARSFRLWTDIDGAHHASAVLDDEGFLWLKTITDTALRPRRGGPHFVDTEEAARAAALTDDARSNDQLAYDLIMDVLRAGALADADAVFGARQPGVRLVQHVDADGRAIGPALAEDGLWSLPASTTAQHICDSGSTRLILDGDGNPLDVGREHRLFTAKQRVALAIRDGGCRWTGCDRPASYCEAHHIDTYSEGGRTDIDRGILLCRFHHMQLHHGQWRITREEKRDFVLRHRSGERTLLPRRTTPRYAWAGIDPPPKRFRTAG
ncbi:HNH endonuclease signature motif containing protein [Microbacterium paludicola]|uniref:HNH endonuclease signature motif containing protein n=1 Tax=Microbacterium paludicola TaxID=300019 RepID=UPI0011A31CED|nr:HNH endonuclease signature motif containing protein [Microbacterium paludicola]